MPRNAKGERRPADVLGNAVHVIRIATGEAEEPKADPVKEYMRRGRPRWGANEEAVAVEAQRHRKEGGGAVEDPTGRPGEALTLSGPI
jgi:hypothetical protein